ncbi:MAG TPA: DUF5679 domain-containing protein [Roseiflexaceae bacterium]|nr:DUF5679 domain-containing protein [Roseiflexaceae bacterium]
MLKRFLWLVLAAAAAWLAWTRLRQRQDEYARTTPQFAPPHTFAPPSQSQRTERPPAHQVATAEAPAATREAAPAAPASPEPQAAALEAAEAPALASDEIIADVVGYCMRCKTKRPIQNAHHETTESGRPAARGTCPVCGAKMFTFLANSDDSL